jgi:NADPH:quinone reductase-like Zn-dependent oxidoreductase
VSVLEPQRVGQLGGRYHFARPAAGHLARLAEWVDEGRLRVPIGRTFALADAAQAHRLLADGGAGGKIVLTI